MCLAELGQAVMIQGNHDHHPVHDDPETPHDVLSALVEHAGFPGVMYLSKIGYYKIDNVAFGLITVHGSIPHGECNSGKEEIRNPYPPPEQCVFFSRNIGWLTLKIFYLHYSKEFFLEKSIQKTFYLIWKKEALRLKPVCSPWRSSTGLWQAVLPF